MRTGRDDQRAGVATAAISLITPVLVLIRPGTPLPGAQAYQGGSGGTCGIPASWLMISAAGTLHTALPGKALSLTYLKSCLKSSDPLPCLLSQRSGVQE